MKPHFTQPLCLALLLTATAAASDDYRDDIGYKTLESHNSLISKGANLTVGQVEAVFGQAYMPDRNASEFSGKHFWPTGIYDASGHATMVGDLFYGKDGIAPNTPNIKVYDSTGFLTTNVLRVGKKGAPIPLNVSVLNNSWVAAFTTDSANVEAVRRLDWMINRDDVLVVSSVGNGAGSDYPKLLATSYNGMAVGVLGFNGSSDGPINFDSRGPRVKPDLVVPVTTTSAAAGIVSGAAALIRSEAKARHMNVSELTTKAILMAGANRPDDWERGAAGTFDDQTVPLDYRYGAGGLRVDNSFDILVAGKRPTGGLNTGWDSGIAHKKNHVYGFRIANAADELDDDANDFTAVLAWNRAVKRSPRGTYSTSLANLELSLMVKNGTRWNRVSRSDSSYDNIETITLSDLAPGAYRLTVRGDRAEPYSLAWFTSQHEDHHGGGDDNSGPGGGEVQLSSMMSGGVTPMAVPEPTLFALLLPAITILARRRSTR